MAESSSNQERARSEVFNEKFDSFKRLASSSFTRAKQFTVEKLGKADSVTEYDDEFEELFKQVTQIKSNTERILNQVDIMVQPNPGIRIETKVYSRLERPHPQHSSPHELLATELNRSGNEFGPETQYGGYLVRCGEVEMKIGTSEKKFQEKVNSEVIIPLRTFLEVDIKSTLREHRALYVKRLDLDSSRADVKKAQQEAKLQLAETALRKAQADYDMQLDKVRNGMEKIVQTHVNNLGQMKTLMSSMKAYYMECLAHIDSIDTGVSLSIGQTDSSTKGDAVKAKVLYDFDASEEKEISVLGGQIITIFPGESDDDFYMAQVDSKFGFIPQSYIELL